MTVKLHIEDTVLTGWERLSVERSLDRLSGVFSISAVDERPATDYMGREVELYLDDSLVITGYVDKFVSSINSEAHSMQISGRDKTGDLVDSSAVLESQEMQGVTLREIIQKLLAPFDINLVYDVAETSVFESFSLQQETVFEAIERACRLRAVMPASDPQGRLVIRNPGTSRSGGSLEMGKNILSANLAITDRDRHSDYYVYGQRPSKGGLTPEAAATPDGLASDEAIRRYRPLIIIAEGNVDPETANTRAQWEAAVRAARAVTATITVQGWKDPAGQLWSPGDIVRTIIPQVSVNSDMLIRAVHFSMDNGGRKTTVGLTTHGAYKPKLNRVKENLNEWALTVLE